MNPKPTTPSHDDISITLKTLSAIDQLQGEEYAIKFEKNIRKKAPHCHTDSVELAEEVLESFTYTAPMGCSKGIMMTVSAFIGGLRMANLENEFAGIIETVTNPSPK